MKKENKTVQLRSPAVSKHSQIIANNKAILGDRQKAAGDHLKNWLKHGERAVNLVSEIECPATMAFHNKVSQANVLLQLEHLKTYSVIRERIPSQELNIHGWWFDVGTGDVSQFDVEQRRFVLIEG
jgi:carbonic anhydrase